jgi:anaphase-promoting complex subunit 1
MRCTQCSGKQALDGADDTAAPEQGIKEVLHTTGTKLTTALGSGWMVRLLHEILGVWS